MRQPIARFSTDEVTACAAAGAGGWASRRAAGMPILLTYMTHLPFEWALGASAALHGIPLIVMGLGREWDGPGVRVPATLRAAQLLDALAPDAAIIGTDGSDALVANAPTAAVRSWAGELARSRHMLLATECRLHIERACPRHGATTPSTPSAPSI